MIDEVPEGFGLRSVSDQDAPTLADLMNECTVAEIGIPWTTAEETRDDLTAPGRDGGRDDALLVSDGGTPVGYLQLFADASPYTELEAIAFVRPAFWSQGLSAWLLRLAERRARDKDHLASPGDRVVLRVARFTGNEPAKRLFESLGYDYARTFWIMRIELSSRPPAPSLPTGILIRPSIRAATSAPCMPRSRRRSRALGRTLPVVRAMAPLRHRG